MSVILLKSPSWQFLVLFLRLSTRSYTKRDNTSGGIKTNEKKMTRKRMQGLNDSHLKPTLQMSSLKLYFEISFLQSEQILTSKDVPINDFQVNRSKTYRIT